MRYIYISGLNRIELYELWSPPAEEPLLMQLLLWKPANPQEYYASFLEQWSVFLNLKGIPPLNWFEAAWMDTDNQRLFLSTWLQTAYTSSLRRAYLWLLHATWPDWEIHWLPQGMPQLAEMLGYQDPLGWKAFSNQAQFAAYLSNSLEFFKPAKDISESDIQTISEYLTEIDEQPECLITLKTNSFIRDYGFSILSSLNFMLGPHIIPKLYNLPSIPLLQENSCSCPRSGIFIDQTRWCIYFWIDQCVDPLIVKEMEKIWRGWRVFWHTKGLPYHYALSGRDPRSAMLPFKDVETSLRQWFDTPSVCFPLDPTEPDEVANPEKLNRLIQELQTRYEDLWK